MKKLISGAVLLLALPAVANVPHILNEETNSDQFKINHKKYINTNFEYLNSKSDDIALTITDNKEDIATNEQTLDDAAMAINNNSDDIAELQAESLGEQLIDYQPTGVSAGDIIDDGIVSTHTYVMAKDGTTNYNEWAITSYLTLSGYEDLIWNTYYRVADLYSSSRSGGGMPIDEFLETIADNEVITISVWDKWGNDGEAVHVDIKSSYVIEGIELTSTYGSYYLSGELDLEIGGVETPVKDGSRDFYATFRNKADQVIYINGFRVRLYRDCSYSVTWDYNPHLNKGDERCKYFAYTNIGLSKNVLVAFDYSISLFNRKINDLWLEQTE